MKSLIKFHHSTDMATGMPRYFLPVSFRETWGHANLSFAKHKFDIGPMVGATIEFYDRPDEYEFYYTFHLPNNSIKLGTFIMSLLKNKKDGTPKGRFISDDSIDIYQPFSFKESVYYALRLLLNSEKITYHDTNLVKAVNQLCEQFELDQNDYAEMRSEEITIEGEAE